MSYDVWNLRSANRCMHLKMTHNSILRRKKSIQVCEGGSWECERDLRREKRPWEHLRQRNQLCMCGNLGLSLLLILRLWIKTRTKIKLQRKWKEEELEKREGVVETHHRHTWLGRECGFDQWKFGQIPRLRVQRSSDSRKSLRRSEEWERKRAFSSFRWWRVSDYNLGWALQISHRAHVSSIL